MPKGRQGRHDEVSRAACGEVSRGSLDDFPDGVLLKRFSSFGRTSKIASRRALALLPEIIRRGLHRQAGFASHYAFAFKKVGVTKDVVDKVLRLHDRIGHMPELWGLLASGREGWSKLEMVAIVARPDTASWWAERLPKWSRPELADYLRRLRPQRPSQAPDEEPSLAFESLIEASRAGAPLADPLLAGTSATGAFLAPEAGDPERSAEGSDPIPLSSLTDESACADVEGGEPLSGPLLEGSRFSKAVTLASPKLRPVTVYLSPEDEELLRALHDQIQRQRGEAISLGEVVRALLRQGLQLGGAGNQEGGAFPSGGSAPLAGGLSAGATTEVSSALDGVARRTVEVVLRAAELGPSWMPRFKGILPSGLARAFKVKDSVDLGDLYAEAVRAADRYQGKDIPVAVRKFVALRALLRCEVPGCDKPIAELHHLKPRTEGGNHHPDNCRALCALHHSSHHGEIYSKGPAGDVVEPGGPLRGRPADQAFQAVRARVAGG